MGRARFALAWFLLPATGFLLVAGAKLAGVLGPNTVQLGSSMAGKQWHRRLTGGTRVMAVFEVTHHRRGAGVTLFT
jgi:hypothetical protein